MDKKVLASARMPYGGRRLRFYARCGHRLWTDALDNLRIRHDQIRCDGVLREDFIGKKTGTVAFVAARGGVVGVANRAVSSALHFFRAAVLLRRRC